MKIWEGVKEVERQIVYGQWKTGMEERKEAAGYILRVHEDICDIKKRYMKLGFHLAEIERCEYYRDIGYTKFYEFCESNYGLKKSEVSRCMNVFYRFSQRNGNVPTMFPDERYEEYDYSQLVEMLPLEDKEIKYIKPSMSVREIREFKKNCRGLSEEKIKEYVSGKSCDVSTEEKEKPEETVEEDIKTENVRKKFDYEKFIKIKGKEKRRKYIEETEDSTDRQGYIKIIDSDGKIKVFRNTRLLDEENFIFYVPYQMPDDKQVSSDKSAEKKKEKDNE